MSELATLFTGPDAYPWFIRHAPIPPSVDCPVSLWLRLPGRKCFTSASRHQEACGGQRAVAQLVSMMHAVPAPSCPQADAGCREDVANESVGITRGFGQGGRMVAPARSGPSAQPPAVSATRPRCGGCRLAHPRRGFRPACRLGLSQPGWQSTEDLLGQHAGRAENVSVAPAPPRSPGHGWSSRSAGLTTRGVLVSATASRGGRSWCKAMPAMTSPMPRRSCPVGT